LGILLIYNGNFTIARKKLSEQAQKARYALYRKLRNISIPIDLQLKLFDSLIEFIFLYSCEIWGFENLAIQNLRGGARNQKPFSLSTCKI
jgi:hypothetical protein